MDNGQRRVFHVCGRPGIDVTSRLGGHKNPKNF